MARGDGFKYEIVGELGTRITARCGEVREVGEEISFGD